MIKKFVKSKHPEPGQVFYIRPKSQKGLFPRRILKRKKINIKKFKESQGLSDKQYKALCKKFDALP